MRQNTNRQARRATNVATDPVAEYIAILHEIYPPARGRTQVAARSDRVIVNVPLPTRVSERMRLFDQMAEVATRILVETDEYIILSGWFDRATASPRKKDRRN